MNVVLKICCILFDFPHGIDHNGEALYCFCHKFGFNHRMIKCNSAVYL